MHSVKMQPPYESESWSAPVLLYKMQIANLSLLILEGFTAAASSASFCAASGCVLFLFGAWRLRGF
jgi:hypothetical protein